MCTTRLAISSHTKCRLFCCIKRYSVNLIASFSLKKLFDST